MKENKEIIENMKIVYIASQYGGNIEKNIKFAKQCCLYAVEMGCCPIAVHLIYPQFLNELKPEEREIGLQMGLKVLEKCDELWVCGDVISEGMKREIAEAEKMAMDVICIDFSEIEEITSSEVTL